MPLGSIATLYLLLTPAPVEEAEDLQLFCLSLRFGQEKPVYIYRFLAKGTMEEKIYDRQVTDPQLYLDFAAEKFLPLSHDVQLASGDCSPKPLWIDKSERRKSDPKMSENTNNPATGIQNGGLTISQVPASWLSGRWRSL